MRTIYIADDGKQFDDEFECLDYEWHLHHPFLKKIAFLDVNNNLIINPFTDKAYSDINTVIVHNLNELQDLSEFIKYTGFLAYQDITEPGVWRWNDKEEKFYVDGGK